MANIPLKSIKFPGLDDTYTIAAEEAADIADLKSAFDSIGTPVVLSDWESGSFRPADGTNTTSTSYIRNQMLFGLSTGVLSVKCDSGYLFLPRAWNASGTYLGTLQTNNTFSTTGTSYQMCTSFDCGMFPDYKFKVALRMEPSSTSITTADGSHCSFDYATDKTLTRENKAADAKATGDAIATINGVIQKTVTIPYWEFGNISPSAGTNATSTTRLRTTQNITISSRILGFTCGTGYNMRVFRYKVSDDSYDGAASATGWTKTASEVDLKTSWIFDFTISGVAYYYRLVIGRTDDGTIALNEAQNTLFTIYGSLVEIDPTLSIAGKAADAKATGDAIAAMQKTAPIQYWTRGSISPSAGSDASSTTRLRTTLNITSDSGILGFTCGNGYNMRILRYKVSDGSYDGAASATGWTKTASEVDLKTSWTFEFTINDVPYYYRLVLGRTDDGAINIDEAQNTAFRMYDWIESKDEYLIEQTRLMGLHEVPRNTWVLNMVKRARQLTDVKWTPAIDLPRLLRVEREYPYPATAQDEFYEGTFKAGVEYTGIPYGRANDVSDYGLNYGYIGNYIGIDTFVTAVQDANSFLCKESVFDLSDNQTLVYASVCSSLVTYALGVSYVGTSDIPEISGLTLVGKMIDDGAQLDPANFKIGDVLCWASHHAAVITDVIRDGNGTVIAVEVAEATVSGLADSAYDEGPVGGLARRKGWTLEQMYTKWGAYSLYRYSAQNKIAYNPSPYVNVGGELDMYRVNHYPCMPYEGNNFKYKAASIPNSKIKILINSADYGYLKVFKGDSEITGSPFTVTSGTDEIEITEIGAGDYSAYLCNISDDAVTNLSYTCHWKISS